MDNIILELGSKIDNIVLNYQEIENLIYDSSEYFQGDAAESLREKFNNYQKQFAIIKKNYMSYQSDLITIKSTMINLDTSNVNKFETFTDQVNKDAKDI